MPTKTKQLSTPLKSEQKIPKIAIELKGETFSKAPFLVSMLDLGGVKVWELGVLKSGVVLIEIVKVSCVLGYQKTQSKRDGP